MTGISACSYCKSEPCTCGPQRSLLRFWGLRAPAAEGNVVSRPPDGHRWRECLLKDRVISILAGSEPNPEVPPLPLERYVYVSWSVEGDLPTWSTVLSDIPISRLLLRRIREYAAPCDPDSVVFISLIELEQA